MRKSKRLGAAVLAAAAMSGALADPAAAHGDDDEQGGGDRANHVEVTHREVSWTLTEAHTFGSAQCDLLPAGTTINGRGTLVSRMTVSLAANGVRTEEFDERARGRATDQAGNRYRWEYDNESSVTNSVASPLVYTGEMTDAFELGGKGPISLDNGFEADIVDNRVAGTFTINPRSSFGDPFDFPNGPNRCDPL